MGGGTPETTDLTRAPAPLVLFDGECNLCNGAVRWILERDEDEVFRFGSLQWESARSAILARAGTAALEDLPDSIVLLDDDGLHVRSEAALRIAERLGTPWSLLSVFRIVPRAVRDAVYGRVARNRYDWFGKRASCMRPTEELRGRFLEPDSTQSTGGAE